MIVALYARVSTSKQADKDLSIPDQLSQMRAWCQAIGHTLEPNMSSLERRPQMTDARCFNE
jgi:DNA invertase Pin-like site-specific DNA recombinase